MPKRSTTCQVCRHPRLREIHERLLQGEPRRRVAIDFGLSVDAMDRHWWRHMPDDVKAAADAARSAAGPPRLDAIEGAVLLGQAATVYERAQGLLDTLEGRLQRGEEVDARSVVAALREVRQSLETVAKLAFAVSDRPTKPVESELPQLDAAIIEALNARDFGIESPASDEAHDQHRSDAAAALLPPAQA
jgi:hypothetical protein